MHMSNADARVLAHVARNVRRARKASGLSQEALAERAGISRRTVIALEAGEANISLSGLDHLAAALGTDFTTLVKAPSAPAVAINETLWRGRDADSVAVLLGSAPATTEAQLWSWTLAPGERYDAEPDPPGWHEIILVTAGNLRIERDDGSTDLGDGQHAIYPSDQHYTYAAIGNQTAHFIRIVAS